MSTPREMWEEAGLAARTGAIFGTMLIVAFAAAASYWVLRDPEEVLFSGLEPRDAAAVVAELERMKVPFELADGGTKVLVGGSRVPEVRLKLMGSGLPLGGGVGFELFNDSDFGMTEFEQRITFQRAMQGELERTIASLREVKHARVHLVMPQGGLFGSRQRPASAAVHLVLAGDQVLAGEQVLGIQRLVAASVEGLDAEKVTVVDQDGVTLSRPASEQGDLEAVSVRLAKKREVERYLREKVETVLERTLGTREGIVSIDVSLEMDQLKTTVQNVVTREDGTGWVKRRRETRSWNGSEGDGGRKDGGLTTETEYDLGRRVEEIVAMPGAVERLSVGVLLPGPLDGDEIAKIEEVVAMAVGYSEQRGDSIAVHAIGRSVVGLPDAPGPISQLPQGGPLLDAPERSLLAEPEETHAAEVRSHASAPPRVAAPPPRWTPWPASWSSRLPRLPAGLDRHLTVLVLAATGLLLAAALGASGRRGRRAPVAASPHERERVLAQVKSWLDGDARGTDDGGTS